MEIFRKTMDFFQKNSHVFRISWEKIEGTREKRQKQKGRRNIHKGIRGRNRKRQNQVKNKSTTKTKRIPQQKQKASTAKTKGIHGRNRKRQNQVKNKSTTKTNPRQKRKERRNIHKGIHDKNKKDSTAKTKRIPHKIGRKARKFVHKSKDLRSKILMQT